MTYLRTEPQTGQPAEASRIINTFLDATHLRPTHIEGMECLCNHVLTGTLIGHASDLVRIVEVGV